MENMTPRKFKLTFGFKPEGVFNVNQHIDVALIDKVQQAHPENILTQEFGELTDAAGVKKNYTLMVSWRVIGPETISGYIENIGLFADDEERDTFLLTLKNKKNGFPALRKS